MAKNMKDGNYNISNLNYNQITELEAKNENLVNLVEKLLTENSRYENSFLAIKSSQFKLLSINKKLCEVVKYLKAELSSSDRKQMKVGAMYKFFKAVCLDNQEEIILQKSTLKKIFEMIEHNNTSSELEVIEASGIKPSLDRSYLFTI